VKKKSLPDQVVRCKHTINCGCLHAILLLPGIEFSVVKLLYKLIGNP